MGKPRKHAEVIKAWADGAEIEYLNIEGKWVLCEGNPSWYNSDEYRVKPEEVFRQVVCGCAVGNSYVAPCLSYNKPAKSFLLDVDADTYIQITFNIKGTE